jgi:hypothetical protein
MELDDFKNIGKTTQLSENKGDHANNEPMETLINELKAADEKQRKKIRVFIIVFAMFMAVYSGILAQQKSDMKTGFALIVLGFACVLLYTFWRFLMINKVDYTAPTAIFLKKAEQRYRFMGLIDFIIIPLLITLLTIGGGLVVAGSFRKYLENVTIPIIIYLVVMCAAVAIGFWSERKNWEKEYGAIIKKIRDMRREFDV